MSSSTAPHGIGRSATNPILANRRKCRVPWDPHPLENTEATWSETEDDHGKPRKWESAIDDWTRSDGLTLLDRERIQQRIKNWEKRYAPPSSYISEVRADALAKIQNVPGSFDDADDDDTDSQSYAYTSKQAVQETAVAEAYSQRHAAVLQKSRFFTQGSKYFDQLIERLSEYSGRVEAAGEEATTRDLTPEIVDREELAESGKYFVQDVGMLRRLIQMYDPEVMTGVILPKNPLTKSAMTFRILLKSLEQLRAGQDEIDALSMTENDETSIGIE